MCGFFAWAIGVLCVGVIGVHIAQRSKDNAKESDIL